jgi:iron(III) transport system substrate-binding protein
MAGLALAGLAACGPGGPARTPLVLYSPHGRDLLTLVEHRYEELHPELDVRWLDMGSQEVFDRLRSEKANPQADVWFGGPDTILARGAAEGLLAPHRPAWVDAVAAYARGTGDLYFGVYRTPPVLVWNRDAVTAADAPRDWDDLLAPRFRDRVLIRDPLASGTMRTVFGMILGRAVAATGGPDAGFEWLRRLDGQTKEYVQNPALLHEKMVRQEGWVTVWDLTDILLQRQKGLPLDYAFPTSGTPVVNDSIGLVAGARHADAARGFIDWVGSAEAQLLAARQVYRIPARTDLAGADLPPWLVQVQTALVPADVDSALLARETGGWMSRWDREVRGTGRASSPPSP